MKNNFLNFYTTEQISAKWGISTRRISLLAKTGKIDGAMLIGKTWFIPKTATKPIDRRCRSAKSYILSQPTIFRFPAFASKNATLFNPPLSSEELILKSAEEAFFACDFEKANDILNTLPKPIKNKYVNIYVLYAMCMIDIYSNNVEHFFVAYNALVKEFQSDFLYKKEMQILIYELEAALGSNQYFLNEFSVDPNYDYHESFLPHLTTICSFTAYYKAENSLVIDIDSLELNLKFLENTDDYVELQAIHLYLGSYYVLIGNTDKINYHFEKALLLAEKYNLFFNLLQQYYFMKQYFAPTLSKFSPNLAKKIESNYIKIHAKYKEFLDAISANTIYKLLPHNEYILLFYALQGYSNKQVAEILHISESIVSKRYAKIYALTDVSNKTELITLYKSLVSSSLLNM